MMKPGLNILNETLIACGRDVNSNQVKEALEELYGIYAESKVDARLQNEFDGDWLLETVPNFPGMKGQNDEGEVLYTLGRLTYNMIQPCDVLCSVQRMTQHTTKLSNLPDCVDKFERIILPEHIPENLRNHIEQDPSELRLIRNDVHFTVQKNGVRGVLQMDGYTIPSRTHPNRYDVWFTGGRCYALDAHDESTARKWQEIFGTELPPLSIKQKIQLWIAKLIFGAEPAKGMQQDGSLTYKLTKPMGGAYQQVLFLGDSWRVTLGNAGTVVVVSRMESAQVEDLQTIPIAKTQASKSESKSSAGNNNNIFDPVYTDTMRKIIDSETIRYKLRVDSVSLRHGLLPQQP